MATAKAVKKSAKAKSATKAKPGAKGRKLPDAKAALLARISTKLGIPVKQTELRALSELAERLGLGAGSAAAGSRAESAAPVSKPVVQATGPSGLPKRLFLLLEGRGIDGRGLPIEVIDLPCLIGSDRKATVWINSPQIETKHLAVSAGETGLVVEDLGTEHGTFFEGERITRRVLQHGDEFLLAGYLRLRAEFR